MNKHERQQIILTLIDRDGYKCAFPGCIRPFSEEDPPTIDHWIPRDAGGQDVISNYKLMHFVCNNIKGNSIPDPDGTIDLNKRIKLPKAQRPELCTLCMSGRLLLVGELCPDCGSGPQPRAFPTAYKKKPKNCKHSGNDHCWLCVVGLVPRMELH